MLDACTDMNGPDLRGGAGIEHGLPDIPCRVAGCDDDRPAGLLAVCEPDPDTSPLDEELHHVGMESELDAEAPDAFSQPRQDGADPVGAEMAQPSSRISGSAPMSTSRRKT